MGLMIEETPPAPVVRAGEECLEKMAAEYAYAASHPDYPTRVALIDGLNVRYRSKPVRDWINSRLSAGLIDESVVRDMQQLLASHRHNPRLPAAKAFRYQWP